MRLSKSKRLVGMAIWFTVLLALPLYMEIYYRTLYYVGAIFLMPIYIYRIVWDRKFEKKFYKRWDRAREQGFWVNVAREGLRSFVLMTVITMISQFPGSLNSHLVNFQLSIQMPSNTKLGGIIYPLIISL